MAAHFISHLLTAHFCNPLPPRLTDASTHGSDTHSCSVSGSSKHAGGGSNCTWSWCVCDALWWQVPPNLSGKSNTSRYTKKHLFTHFYQEKHMLSHPWHASPQPACASRVQPLTPRVRPLQLWLLGYHSQAAGVSWLHVCHPIAQSSYSPTASHNQQKHKTLSCCQNSSLTDSL